MGQQKARILSTEAQFVDDSPGTPLGTLGGHLSSGLVFFMSLGPFNFAEMNITVTSLAKIAAVYHNACYKPCRDLKVHNRAADGTVNFYYRL